MFYDEERDRSEMLTVEDAAKLLNYTPQRVRQLLREHKLLGYKVEGGRKWLIPRGEIDRYLRTTKYNAESERDLKHKQSQGGVLSDARALQMERSGHWPGMRDIAVTVQKQLSAPLLEPLLGLDKLVPRNPYLVLVSSGDQAEVILKVEEEPIFSALREHLPKNPAWDLLGGWKQQAARIQRQLPGLCQRVTEQPELSNLTYIPPEEPICSNSGVTEFFAKIIVQTAAEDVYRDMPVDDFLRRSMDLEYKPRSLKPESDRQALDWTLVGSGVTIAVNEDSGELERIKDLHIKLRIDFRAVPELQALVAAFKELHRLRGLLARELEWIAHLAVFPLNCRLCSS